MSGYAVVKERSGVYCLPHPLYGELFLETPDWVRCYAARTSGRVNGSALKVIEAMELMAAGSEGTGSF